MKHIPRRKLSANVTNAQRSLSKETSALSEALCGRNRAEIQGYLQTKGDLGCEIEQSLKVIEDAVGMAIDHDIIRNKIDSACVPIAKMLLKQVEHMDEVSTLLDNVRMALASKDYKKEHPAAASAVVYACYGTNGKQTSDDFTLPKTPLDEILKKLADYLYASEQYIGAQKAVKGR